MSLSEPTLPRASHTAPLERLSLLISLVVVGLGMSRVLDLPPRTLEFSVLGSRATITLSGAWLFAIVLAVLTATGVESIHRSHPRVHLSQTRYTAILWILPALQVALAALILPFFSAVFLYGFVFILLAAGLLTVIILAEYHTIDASDALYAISRLGLNLAGYALALILFWSVYNVKARSLLSAPIIGTVSALVALELLRGNEAGVRRTWLYGAAIGLMMGEVLWAMNYWNVNGLFAGLVMTTLFYVLVSTAQQYLWGHLSWWMLAEFALVILIVAFLAFRFAPF